MTLTGVTNECFQTRLVEFHNLPCDCWVRQIHAVQVQNQTVGINDDDFDAGASGICAMGGHFRRHFAGPTIVASEMREKIMEEDVRGGPISLMTGTSNEGSDERS